MRSVNRSLVLGLAVLLALVLAAVPAAAGKSGKGKKPGTDGSNSKKLTLLGATGDNRPVVTFAEAFFTDMAFQGDYAYQGTWNGGFRTIDISKPWRPKPAAEVDCGTFQGDIGVWGDLVFRSIDTPIAARTVAETCESTRAASGFEGIQIFEVDDPEGASAADLVAAVATDCGSHTHTVVPDLENDRVLLYVSASGTSPVYDNDPVWGHECSAEHDKFQIVDVPLDDPEDASVIADVPLEGGHSCHDIGVLVKGRSNLAVCAGMQAIVYDIENPAEPLRLTDFTAEGVTGWHSAALSWDGEVTVMGWEPGGGVGPECEAGDPDFFKSIFFFDTASGALLGTWVLPRSQSAAENCTIHNYNVIPTRKGDVLVAGNYQAGTWVVDFTDPRSPKTLAWSDPPPLSATLQLGGAWGSYWYRNHIYETNISKGLRVYRLENRFARGVEKFDVVNPQTQLWEDKRGKKKRRS